MASKIYTRVQTQSLRAVEGWLRAEDEVNSTPEKLHRLGNPQNARAHLLMNYLPDLWEKYRYQRKILLTEMSERGSVQSAQGFVLNIGRGVLSLASGARKSFLLAGQMQGVALNTAKQTSWKVSEEYRKNVAQYNTDLPERNLLSMPLEQAIQDYYPDKPRVYGNTRETYVACMGLAARALLEMSEDSLSKLALPDPQSTESRLWDYRHSPFYKQTLDIKG